jgi:hypothetical protein
VGNGNNNVSLSSHTFGSASDRKILARPALRPDDWAMNQLHILGTRYALNLLLCLQARIESKIENSQEAPGLFEESVVNLLRIFSAMSPRLSITRSEHETLQFLVIP